MDTEFAIELLKWGVLTPAGISMAVLFVGRFLLPERCAGGVAFTAAVLTGYLLLDWAKVVPERHYQWVPWLPLIALIPLGTSLAQGIGRTERVAGFIPVAALAAWLIVPSWQRLDDARWYYLACVGGGLLALCVLFDVLASRMRPAWFLALCALTLGAYSGIVMAFQTVKHGQMLLAACGAALGTAAISVPRRAAESARAVAPHCGLILGAGVFISYIEQDPPVNAFLLPLAVPLVLIPLAVGPLAGRGWKISTLQAVLVIGVLAGTAGWLHMLQNAQPANPYSY